MQAEVPQPISAIPSRWGALTTPQLTWLGVALLPLYLAVRLHLPTIPAAAGSAPWVIAATTMAFGRCQGRRLDAFLSDWARFQFQAKNLAHPELFEHEPVFKPVDAGGCRPLPWSHP